MTAKELRVVREHLKCIFGDWHACRLSAKDAKAMNLKPGRLCDGCLSGVKAEMASIREFLK